MTTEIGQSVIPPLAVSLEADDIVEFHAARILVLLRICGEGAKTQSIVGRTKLAKLDFFLRYPRFLEIAQRVLSDRGEIGVPFVATAADVEAPMIRYRFGPWDPRYRAWIGFLEARKLVRLSGTTTERLALTATGARQADLLIGDGGFNEISGRAEAMKENLATWPGGRLKDFIYEIFHDEVTTLASGREIAS